MSQPRLLGNTGEPGEFVIPTSNPNADSKAEMDDFTYDAITWDLTAHEARPGHELQFAAMLEAGVSTARAVFAFNSANVEGWGLYSEQLVKPYLSPEGQLGVLRGTVAARRARLPRPDDQSRHAQAGAGQAHPAGGGRAVRAHGEAGNRSLHVQCAGAGHCLLLWLQQAAVAAREDRDCARQEVRRAVLPRLHPCPGAVTPGPAGAGRHGKLRPHPAGAP